jgi:hypothetical protein
MPEDKKDWDMIYKYRRAAVEYQNFEKETSAKLKGYINDFKLKPAIQRIASGFLEVAMSEKDSLIFNSIKEAEAEGKDPEKAYEMRLMIAGYLVGRFIGEHLDNFPNEEER